MRYQHLTDNCLAGGIGDDGLTDDAFARVLLAAAPAHDRLCHLHDSGRLPCLSVVGRDDDLEAVRALAEDWRGRLEVHVRHPERQQIPTPEKCLIVIPFKGVGLAAICNSV